MASRSMLTIDLTDDPPKSGEPAACITLEPSSDGVAELPFGSGWDASGRGSGRSRGLTTSRGPSSTECDDEFVCPLCLEHVPLTEADTHELQHQVSRLGHASRSSRRETAALLGQVSSMLLSSPTLTPPTSALQLQLEAEDSVQITSIRCSSSVPHPHAAPAQPHTAAPSNRGACYRCGQRGHWARECPHNDKKALDHLDRSETVARQTRIDSRDIGIIASLQVCASSPAPAARLTSQRGQSTIVHH